MIRIQIHGSYIYPTALPLPLMTYQQAACAGLGMSLQLEGQYLQRTVPEAGNLVGAIETALRETFFPTLFVGEEVDAGLR